MKTTEYTPEQIEAVENSSHTMEQVEALMECASCTVDEAIDYLDSQDYAVYTDDEADEKATEYIEDSLWAFNANFICDYMPNGLTPDDVDALRGDKCESINDAFRALVEAGEGIDALVEAAIAADGRGHFMSTYDGEEFEASNGLYVYRLN